MNDTVIINSAAKYNVSGKRPDTDKWWSYGSFSLRSRPGKDQPQMTIGIRKTEELVALLNATERGGWINLYVFEDRGRREGAPVKRPKQEPVDLSDSIPF